MKKFLTKFVALCLVVCSILTMFTACDFDDTSNSNNNPNPPTHSCLYNKKIITEKYKLSDATCLKKATYYYSCNCGEKGNATFEHGNISEHIFINKICKWCGTPQNSQSNTTNPSSPTQPEQIERTVYITPSGKRFHYLQSCAGKNATKTTQKHAEQIGLTACKKCT